MNIRTDPVLELSDDGWVAGAEHMASPNCDARPQHQTIRLLVVHAISLPPGQFAGTHVAELFTNSLDPQAHPYFSAIAGRRVSAHFFIRRDGTLVQFVSCLARAWHAGTSCWRGVERCNDFSLGIELEGDDFTPFEPAQYRRLVELIGILRRTYPIEDIVGHADIAPGRKTDPGPFFDWSELATATRDLRDA